MRTQSSDIYVLDPFEDELLTSAVARTHVLMGYKSRLNTFLRTFNLHSANMHPARIANNLEIFEDSNLALSHTVYPYYMSTFSLERQKKFLRVLFSIKEKEKLRGKTKLVRGNLFQKKSLFYCPECLKEDELLVGMPYFHVSHQIEGITACAKHKVHLLAYDPEHSRILPVLKPKDYRRSEKAAEREIRFAEWMQTFAGMSHEYLASVYCSRLIEMYPSLENKLCDKPLFLYKLILERFGTEFIKKMNCLDCVRTQRNNWVSSILKIGRDLIHPFYHLMFWETLELTSEDFKEPKAVSFQKSRLIPENDSDLEFLLNEYGVTNALTKTNQPVKIYYPNLQNEIQQYLNCLK